MKNPTQPKSSSMPSLVKFFFNAFKSVFTSESQNEFSRLKNFIAS
jgi:hypothetical protein